MKFSAKKIGNILGKMASKDETSVLSEIKEVAKFLVNSGKTSKLNDVIRSFSYSFNKHTNSIDLVIKSADKESIPDIKEIHGKKVFLKKVVDESLIGGLVIESDDWIYDGSLKTKIEKLKKII